ncbi:MAG: hypothetical protein ACP5R5_09260, partial [Armatimonadota bacterium]
MCYIRQLVFASIAVLAAASGATGAPNSAPPPPPGPIGPRPFAGGERPGMVISLRAGATDTGVAPRKIQGKIGLLAVPEKTVVPNRVE